MAEVVEPTMKLYAMLEKALDYNETYDGNKSKKLDPYLKASIKRDLGDAVWHLNDVAFGIIESLVELRKISRKEADKLDKILSKEFERVLAKAGYSLG